VTLLAASKIQSRLAANHKVGLKGITSKQMLHSNAQPKVRQACFIRPQVLIDGAHVGLLQAKAVLNSEKPKIHLQDLPERQVGFHQVHGLSNQ
jgi:hypothetical protein